MMIIAAALGLSALPDYLTEVTSPVIEVSGTSAEIAAKGRRCIASQLGSGVAGGELIVSDADGVIVARSASTYRDGFLNWQIRSRLTFEAREGRYRISQTSLERFNEQSGGWSPIGKWRGSGWQKAEAAFALTSNAVSACVQTGPQDDW